MSGQSHVVKLQEGSTQQLVEATICDSIEEHNVKDYESHWKPKLIAAKLAKPDLVQDAHWDWRGKVDFIEGDLSYTAFAIERDGLTQGLMILELVMHRSKIKPGDHLAYIDYLAVAPWNREVIQNPPQFRGIGRILIAQAIGTSLGEGFHGRIGLHSLPSARGYYIKLGMTSLGKDPAYKGQLEYFEMSKEVASRFLSETLQ